MAITTPMGDTSVNAQNYENPFNTAAAQALGTSISNGTSQGIAAANAAKELKLKALLQGQTQAGSIAALQKLKETNPNSKIDVGDVSVGQDPAIALQQKAMKATKDDYDNLEKHFGPQTKDIEGSAQQIEDGLNGLKLGSKEGDQQAITAITKLSDGKSARLTQALLQKYTPKDSQGTFTNMMNYWTNKADSGLSPDERSSIANLLQSHTQSLHDKLADTTSEFQQQAPHFAPNLAASGQLAGAAKDFGARAGSALQRIDSLTKQIQGSPPSQIASARAGASGVAPSAADSIGSKLKAMLFGGGAQAPSAQAAPPSAPPQGSAPQAGPPPGAPPSGATPGFDVDSYLSGK